MAIVVAKFTPKQGGSEFELRNIENVSWSVLRQPGPNGHVGMRGFQIGTISISRIKSLQDATETAREDETVKLASGTDKKAYFSGEITVAPPDDEANIIQTVRWENGFISSLTSTMGEACITEHLEVTVTDLMVDDYEFKRVNQ